MTIISCIELLVTDVVVVDVDVVVVVVVVVVDTVVPIRDDKSQ